MIKMCASGGVMSELDHPIHQQFTAAELRTIVEVAGLADWVVAANCHGKPGLLAALEAGVRTIAHGTLLAAGYDADVITLSADPVADITVLTDPARVIGVWTGGRQVKGAPAV